MRYKYHILFTLIIVMIVAGCRDEYLDDYYVTPVASFSTNLSVNEVPTLESILFTNTGKGQNFSIWTGDAGHKYGTTGNSGFAIGTSGEFSYSYREPGVYKIVWVASSLNAKKEVETDIDSITINIVDNNSGLDNISIFKIYRMDDYDDTRNTFFHSQGVFVNDTTIMCPIIYEAWRNGTINSIKSKKLYLKYQLTSTTSTLYWLNEGEWKTIRSEVDNYFCVMENDRITPQRIKVVTASNRTREFLLYAVMMPKITTFSINGSQATITHDISSYNIYDVDLTLPAETNLSQLTPEFEIMGADNLLLDGANMSVSIEGEEQQSGISKVDFSNGPVTYLLKYTFPGANPQLCQTAEMRINIQLQ